MFLNPAARLHFLSESETFSSPDKDENAGDQCPAVCLCVLRSGHISGLVVGDLERAAIVRGGGWLRWRGEGGGGGACLH